MAIYTLRSFALSGKLVAVQQFPAETDTEALSMVRDMVRGASAVSRFDLWEGTRHIRGVAPTIREKPRR
jgi:hypothetical protein